MEFNYKKIENATHYRKSNELKVLVENELK